MSSCTYEGGVDKVGATSRNECPTVGGVLNSGAMPTKCRAGTPTATATVSMDISWLELSQTGPIPSSVQDALISIYQAELEALYSSLSLAFTIDITQLPVQTSGTGSIWTSKLVATADTNNPDAFSAISDAMLQANVRAAVDIAMPGKVDSVGGASTSVSKITSTEEISTEEDGSGGGMGAGALIGIVVGAIAVAGLVGAIAYRMWSHKPNPIDNVSVGRGSQGLTVSGVDACLSDVDTCLSAARLELSEQPIEHAAVTMTQSGNTGFLCSIDPDETKCTRTHSLPHEFFEYESTLAMNTADVEPAPSA